MSTSLGDRIIVLIDMDCFYCQVEAKLQPEWKGRPMAVVQYNLWRSGAIIAVNYEARDFGVTRHMRGDEAKEKCPEIVLAVVPSLRGKADTSKYRTAGRSVIDVMKTHCNKIERASVDEAYLDITQLVDERLSQYSKELDTKLNTTFVVGHTEVGNNDEEHRLNGLKEWLKNDVDDLQVQRLAIAGLIVEEIRADIFEKTEYRCSAGISFNKILAKLACGLHKPNRQTILPAASVPSLFSTLPVKKVRNLGGKFGDIVIESLKCNVMADLLQYSLQYLQNRFDEKTGLWLFNIARGIDNEPVTNRLLANSIGACKRFPGKQALKTPENLKHWLSQLSAEVCERLEQDREENERRATHLTLSYQFHHDENTIISQSKSLPLNSYKQERVIMQCFDVVTKIQRPIAFLGLSAAKFVKAKGSENFRNFFRADRTQVEHPKSSTSKEDKLEESMNVSRNNSEKQMKQADKNCEKKQEKKVETPTQDKSKKINSFFKLINNIPSPKCETKKGKENETSVIEEHNETEEKVVIEEKKKGPEKKSTQFFAKLVTNKNTTSVQENRPETSEKSIVRLQEAEKKNTQFFAKLVTNKSTTSVQENRTEKSEKSTVRLQDIFPDLNNIDRDILACLPPDLQKEAAAMIKNKTTENVSPKTAKQSGKTKLEKPKKSKGKPIESFFIKTGTAEVDENFVKCEQCGQMISAEKLDEHSDYHVAQRLQKDFNRLEGEDNSNKRKNSSDDSCFPNKRLADESRG